jgi:hypothetical protein
MARVHGRALKLTTHLLEQFGVSQDAKYDALKFVEGTGMVSAERANGKNPIVRIIPKPGKDYVKGPLSLPWFQRALKLNSHCALVVSMVIWYVQGLQKRDMGIEITSTAWELFGVDRAAKCRWLKALEARGLIEVVLKNRQSTVVNIIRVDDAPADGTTGAKWPTSCSTSLQSTSKQ